MLNERTRRCGAATEARALGHGGISLVAEAVGLARGTLHAGVAEVQAKGTALATQRIRSCGGGRQNLTEKAPALGGVLHQRVAPSTRGDPASPLRWTCKSTTRLAQEVGKAGHPSSQRSGCSLLHAQHSSLHADRQPRAGRAPPERDAPFQSITASVKPFQRAHRPVLAVDTKKKARIGNFKNPGREWQPKGAPEAVNVQDVADPHLGEVIPYGV